MKLKVLFCEETGYYRRTELFSTTPCSRETTEYNIMKLGASDVNKLSIGGGISGSGAICKKAIE